MDSEAATEIPQHIQAIEILLNQGRLDSALDRISSLAQQCRAAQFADTSQAAHLLTLGSVFESQGRLSGATMAYTLAATIVETASRLNRLAADSVLYEMASTQFSQGLFHRAEVFCKEALALWEQAGDPRRVGAHILLGNILGQFGLREQTYKHYRQAVEICTEIYGENDYNTAAAKMGLANMFYYAGRFAEAEFTYHEVLNAYIETRGENDRYVGAVYINLGLVCDARGDHQASEEHYTRALRIMEKAKSARGVARALESLAKSHLYRGDLDQASSYLTRALGILEKEDGTGSPFLTTSITDLAAVRLRMGDIASAERLQRRALRIIDSVFGGDHPNVASRLVDLGEVLLADNRAPEAEQLFLEAQQIVTQALGDEDPQIAACDEALRDCYRALGKDQLALEYAIRAVQLRLGILRDFAPVVAEQDALIASLRMRRSLDAFLSHYFQAQGYSTCTMDTVADIILAGKGAISEAVFERGSILARMVDSTASDLWEAYRNARYQQSKLYVQGPAAANDAGYRSALDSLARIVARHESVLAQHMEQFRQKKQQRNLTCKGLAGYLPQNSALVEYVRYTDPYLGHAPGIARYAAVTIRDDGGTNLIQLGDARRIDDLIGQYKEHFRDIASKGHLPTAATRAEYERIAVGLFRLLWTPVENDVRRQDLVLISPDGPLNLIAFATLIDDDRGQYLVEKYAIHYLSAGRDLIRLSTLSEPGSGLLAIGDPDFNTTAGDDSGYSKRSARPGCRELQEIKLTPLPATRTEIERTLELWSSQRSEKTIALLGPEASEERFKQEASGKRVIHLATHGYSLFGSCSNDPVYQDMATDRGDAMENPLLQSGLFLAGANPGRRKVTVPPGTEDGVLTAAEITATDLSGTELVVLSACETGLGVIQQGEGVYGLRRAFQMAGARTVVSTLWKISDEHTAPMLPTIYGLGDEPLPTRLRLSQRNWIDRLRNMGLADHPFSWGAFVAIGDWR